MANFEFTKKKINLKICNKTYQVDDDKNLVKKLLNFGNDMKEKADSISLNNNTYEYYEKVITDICNECYKFLDSLLGENASKEIFKDRMYDVEDCMSLLNFIRIEIDTQKEQRLNKYSNSRIERNQNFKKKR